MSEFGLNYARPVAVRDAANYLIGRLLYEIAERLVAEGPQLSDDILGETIAAIREREIKRSLMPGDDKIPLLPGTIGEYRLLGLGQLSGRDIRTLLEGGVP